ncbi:MAG: ATP-binding protein, partial [Ktedonobacterales bacterium]
MSTPLQTSFICPALVGRESYLVVLPSVLEGVRRGEGATLLVSGEAGIGKSRMLRATREMAQARDFTIIQGHCFEHDSTLAYGPLLDALRACAAKTAPAVIRDPLEAARGELARLLPELAGGTAESGLGELPTLDAETEKRRLFQALTRFFSACAETAPLLLVIEDLHWCDAVSLDFLTQLARRLPGQPLLVALSYRANEVQPPLRHLLAELDRMRLATEWPLMPLDETQVEAMLRAIFGQSDAMHGDVLEAVYAPTEGNPFFVEEMLKALVVAGDLVFADGKWSRRAMSELRIPRSVQDAVQRRAGELSAPAREALRMAAVVGQRFEFELLRDLTEYEDAELLPLVKELIAAQLVIEVSVEQLGFRHALTRRAVYSELMARERRALHRRVAMTLDRLYGQSTEAHLGELAYHLFEAGMWREALDYARRAGDQSLALYAPASALDHYAHAFAAAERLSQPADMLLLLGRGKACEMLGEFAPALADNQRALEVARSSDDRDGEWHALNAIGSLWAARDYAQAGEFFQAALETAQALGDEKLRAHSLNRRANWLVNTGKAEEGVALHREALDLFQRLGDQVGIAQTYDLIGMASGIYGDAIGAVQSASKAISLLSQFGDTVNLASSHTTRAAFGNPHLLEPAYSALPTPEDCERDLADARRLARQVGARATEGFAAFTACTTSFAFGDFASGVARGREALRISEEAEHTQWIVAAQHALAFGYSAFLLPDPALAHAEVALTMAKAMGSDWWSGNTIATRGAALLDAGMLDGLDASLLAFLPADRAPRNLPERRIRLVWGRLQL